MVLSLKMCEDGAGRAFRLKGEAVRYRDGILEKGRLKTGKRFCLRFSDDLGSESGERLQFRVDFCLRDVVDVVAQSRQGNAHHDFDSLLLVVTSVEEGFEFGIGYRAFFCHHSLGERSERAQFGIVKLACRQRARGFDGLFGQEFFQGCQLGVQKPHSLVRAAMIWMTSTSPGVRLLAAFSLPTS